jgi:DNA-binding response OmpR family regulator
MLSREGYDIVLATTGGAGIEAIRTHRPVAVLVDLTLPDMTGDDVCRAVRADPSIASTYLVILTARDEMEARNRARQCGADAYACKPCDPDRLVELIEQGFGAAATPYAPEFLP